MLNGILPEILYGILLSTIIMKKAIYQYALELPIEAARLYISFFPSIS